MTHHCLYLVRLQSTISGPQEGMYFIHPNHIAVRLPKDCNDDDIILGESSETVTRTQPTSMAFFLARVRLASLCRELTDMVPLETSKLLQVPYDYIMALDQRFNDFLSNQPIFFRLDEESLEKARVLETVYPHIPIMRYCITTAAHSRRCRLHQRFLVRQSSDSRYTYSRRACLESARTIIRLFDDARREHDSPVMATARMGMAVHVTYLAISVLVMDLCFNKGETEEDERKAEVSVALRRLDDVGNACALLGQYLTSLHEILESHKICVPGSAPSRNSRAAHLVGDTESGGPSFLRDVQMQSTQLGPDDAHEANPGLGAYFGDSFGEDWDTALMQSGEDLDSGIWDSLFSTLDSHPF